MQSLVSLYSSVTNPSSNERKDLALILEDIKVGTWREQIEQIRGEGLTDVKRLQKNALPCFTPAGTFVRHRREDCFEQHSGIICLDLDHSLANRAAIEADCYTLACHLSCSGTGLAIYARARPDHFGSQDIKAAHTAAYLEVLEYYQQRYKIKLDSVCKDLPRLRIVSYDPDLYYNADALTFGTQPTLSRQQATQILFGDSITNAIDQLELACVDILQDQYEVCMKVAYSLLSEVPESTAKDYMQRLYRLSSKYAIYQDDELNRRWAAWVNHHQRQGSTSSGSCTIATFWYLANQHGGIKPPRTRQLVERTIRAAKRNGMPAPKAVKDAAPLAEPGNPLVESAMQVLANEIYQEPEIEIKAFWYVDDKEKLVIDEKRLLCDWLPANGVMYLKHTEGYELVLVQDKIVEPLEIIALKQMVMLYVSSLPWEFDGIERYQLESAIIRNAKVIFMPDKLHFLPTLQANLLRDGKYESRFFYSNGWLRITPSGWELIPYKELLGYIWRTQVQKRPFAYPVLNEDHQADFITCEFAKLMHNICGGNMDRYMALGSAIGYALHTYKDPSKPYAVILQDQEMGDEPQGGTGKDLVMKAIGYIRQVVYQSGKSFDPMKNFAFQRVDRRTELVVLQDLRKGVSFESLFNIISDGMEVERKHKDQYMLSFEESPKIAITTNYPLRASGSSNSRRKGKGEIEIAPHYSPHHTPFDEFGHVLFTDWDKAEWHRFDNLMASFVSAYLKTGLQASPDINRSANALRASTEDGFAEWMDAWWDDAPKDDRGWAVFRSSHLHREYCTEGSEISLDRFGKWVRAWASARGRKVERKPNGYWKGEKAAWLFISYSTSSPHLVHTEVHTFENE